MAELSGDDVRRVLASVGEGRVRPGTRPGVDAEVDWHGLPVRASVLGANIGKQALALATDLGPYLDVADRLPIDKLLAHVATNASVRMAVHAGVAALESVLVWDEVEPARIDKALHWRLSELYTVACAWRARLGLPPPSDATQTAEGEGITSLAGLKRVVRLPADRALMVAAVAFGVAGADGVITAAERAKLRTWLDEVPAFAGLDLNRVVRAIATLAADPAKTLMEAARRLEPRARLLAWALANDMAFADGFASDDERRYLANVATVFKLDAHAIAPLAAEAQERAVQRETLLPDLPPTRDHGV